MAIIPYVVLLHQILPRLPTKSVARFTCVSKELHSFLSSETFKKMHKRMHIPQDKFLFLIHDYKEPRTLGTIDCEAPNDVLTFKLPMKSRQVRFITSFDGLVCVNINYTIKSRSDLVLWNPLTGDWKMLSKPKDLDFESLGLFDFESLALFYSSCEDDYKLLFVICYKNIVNIYSLKSDSWKTVTFKGTSDLKIFPFDDIPHDLTKYRLSQGTCLNEYIYFLDDRRKYSVVRFDTNAETFAEMNTLDYYVDIDHYSAILMIKNGCIHVCITYQSCVRMACFEIELWKIDEKGYWKKMESYQVDPGYMRYMKPLHLMRNGNLLMLGTRSGNLYKVDLKKKHIKGKGKDKDKETRYSNMEISDFVRYIETSVSPNQYTK